jgi:hypothetical protein
MWAALIFAGISLISLPAAISSGSPLVMVQWLASVFLQLVLLPVIMVGQSIQSARTEQKIDETHNAALAEVALTRDLVQAIHGHLGVPDGT